MRRYLKSKATTSRRTPKTPSRPHSPLSAPKNPRDFFRTVAELGIQAAEALDHAHQMGIVHRDIKPSNLMVESVVSGQLSVVSDRQRTTDNGQRTSPHLYITDFGLAHIESDASLTMTGDLLGTLRYMSPEQAEGKSAILDHRTDIYSLGITLYELLTLQPAFPATDRQTLLRQIAVHEPVPLRRLKPSIPVELETIIHKSIAKNPEDRYTTARDFADDLSRFRCDQSIRAKPPTLFRRVRKWGRRHKPVVWSLAVCLLMASVAIGASIGWVLHDRSVRLSMAQQAQAHYDRGFVLHSQGRPAEAVTQYQAAIRLWEDDSWEDKSKAQSCLAAAYTCLGNLLGDQPDGLAEAFELGQKALEIHKTLATENPNSLNHLYNLAIGYANLGNGYSYDWSRYAEAIECWDKSAEILSLLVDRCRAANVDSRMYATLRTSVRSWLCTLLTTCPNASKRNPDCALQLAEAEHHHQPGSVSRVMLGTALIAKEEWQTALERLEDLETSSGDSGAFDRLILMSIALDRLGERDEARDCHRRAIAWLKDNHEIVNRNKFNKTCFKRMQSYYHEMVIEPHD